MNAVAQPKNGHLGCVQSHIRALELAKARGLRNAMILEDDFTFTKPKAEVDATLRRTLDVLGTDWDVLQIGLVPVDVDQAPAAVAGGAPRRVRAASTSSCYVVNAHFYDALLRTFRAAEGQLEQEGQRFGEVLCTPYALDRFWIPLQTASKWYGILPEIGGQRSSASSIMPQHWRSHPSCQRPY